MLSILKKKQIAVLAFFILFFILGVSIFRNYGISWDDQLSRENGVMAYDYITGENTSLLSYVDRDYGTAFELPLVWAEKAFHVTSSQQVFFMRHFLTFLLFFTGTVFFYLIARKRFGEIIGFLGLFFLILSPRIFADSFYNSKDIALLSAITIAIFTMKYFLDKPTWRRALIHGLACAFVIDIRMPGIFIVGLTIGFFVLDTFFLKREPWKLMLKMLLFFTVFFCFFGVLFWPYLWTNPFGNFFLALSNLSHFNRWDDTVLYFGKFVRVTKELPWHYGPVWILITTPFTYLVLFLVGVGITAWRFIRKPLTFYQNHRDDLIFLSWFFLPLLSVIVLKSVLYDGWRQLYFIYPAMILTGLIGVEFIWNLSKKAKRGLFIGGVAASLIVIDLTGVLFFMIVYHPYQNLYFNSLAGGMENAKKNFELDYWGLTFRKGLEYIAANDNSSEIPVFFSQGSQGNIDILPTEDRIRFTPLAAPNGAKYVLTNYRWHPQEYSADYNKVYETKIDGTTVMAVYKFY